MLDASIQEERGRDFQPAVDKRGRKHLDAVTEVHKYGNDKRGNPDDGIVPLQAVTKRSLRATTPSE